MLQQGRPGADPSMACVLLLVVLLAVFGAPPPAKADDSGNITRTVSTKLIKVKSSRAPKGIKARSGIVVDAGTGEILWGRRTGERRLIASTTKMMTAIVAISRTDPGQMLTATRYRAGPGESLLGLRAGERMSAQDLIKGLMLVSGNDAADTLAARTASSRRAFVREMNRKARSLGLTRTRFSGPIGLDSPNNYSTARDLAVLARAALATPRLAPVVRRRRATLRSGSRVRRIVNTNPLVGRYPWAIGVKTGHTMAAGYLLAGAASKADAKIISVVTGEPTEQARLADSAVLLSHGRSFYRTVPVLRRSRPLASLPVRFRDSRVSLYPVTAVSLAARGGQRVVVRLTAPEQVEGPRSRGSVVGRAVVLRDGKPIASVPVALGAAVPAPPASAAMLSALGRTLPLIMVVLAAGMIGSFVLAGRGNRPRAPRFVG